MSSNHDEAPRVVNVGVWSVAVVGALVFAVTLGLGVYQSLNNPISADTDTATAPTTVAAIKADANGKCPANYTPVALRNFPDSYYKSFPSGGIPTSAFESKMGNNWRCTVYCISLNGLSVTDAAGQNAIATYLTGAKIGGKDIILDKTEDEFINNFKTNQNSPTIGDELIRTVILSSTLTPACKGSGGTAGASIDYGVLTIKSGDTVPVAAKNTTADQLAAANKAAADAAAAQKVADAAAAKKAASSSGQGGTEIAAPSHLKAPVKPTGSSDGSTHLGERMSAGGGSPHLGSRMSAGGGSPHLGSRMSAQ
jgi:hypothetical protein